MKMNLFLMQCIGCITLSISLCAQTGTVVCGNLATDNVSEITFSVGQIDFESTSDQEFTISQGLQQPFEISEVVSTIDHKIETKWLVFPNPAYDYINITNESNSTQPLKIEIFDLQGKKIHHLLMSEKTTQIQVSNYNTGTYILNISDETPFLKSYKIIKK
jgi:hypothetical protein